MDPPCYREHDALVMEHGGRLGGSPPRPAGRGLDLPACCVWDKGLAHVAGNTNTQTLRKFPVVTEVCVHYVRQPQFRLTAADSPLSAQQWLRAEWRRTGLPLAKSNEACGVKNAATRKYLTSDYLWYFPPPDVFQRLVDYANTHGDPSGRPYFSVDGETSLAASQWEQLRGKFHCEAGVTNVWHVPAVRGKERIKVQGSVVHPNQKPLALMQLLVKSCSDPGDVVWEPFGGLCTASIAGGGSRPNGICRRDQPGRVRASPSTNPKNSASRPMTKTGKGNAGGPSVLLAYGKENARALQHCSLKGAFCTTATRQ
jgi:hypothetical protein